MEKMTANKGHREDLKNIPDEVAGETNGLLNRTNAAIVTQVRSQNK
jgi:hypothetical protein